MLEADLLKLALSTGPTGILLIWSYIIWNRWQDNEKAEMEYKKERDKKHEENMSKFIAITTESVIMNQQLIQKLEKMSDTCTQAHSKIDKIIDKVGG